TAADYGLTVIAPAQANDPQLERALGELQPDFIFSFYYRSLLGAPLLRAARRGALNMHGSLLPKYRGRAPVNWAILKGERETGARRATGASTGDARHWRSTTWCGRWHHPFRARSRKLPASAGTSIAPG